MQQAPIGIGAHPLPTQFVPAPLHVPPRSAHPACVVCMQMTGVVGVGLGMQQAPVTGSMTGHPPAALHAVPTPRKSPFIWAQSSAVAETHWIAPLACTQQAPVFVFWAKAAFERRQQPTIAPNKRRTDSFHIIRDSLVCLSVPSRGSSRTETPQPRIMVYPIIVVSATRTRAKLRGGAKAWSLEFWYAMSLMHEWHPINPSLGPWPRPPDWPPTSGKAQRKQTKDIACLSTESPVTDA